MDLLNYGQAGIRLQFVPARHALVARATKPIAAGAEMLFYYGDNCREASIDMYGFATAAMPACTAARLGITAAKSVRSSKAAG